MFNPRLTSTAFPLSCAVTLLLLGGGCHLTGNHSTVVQPAPKELAKITLPEYIIEPPDILWIDAIHIVPRAPYRLRTLDSINIQAFGALPGAPIGGSHVIEPGGLVRLGPRYGAVIVGGMTIEEATAAITQHLASFLRDPRATVTLAAMGSGQQISGQHLVCPDGTVTLGAYGSVYVAGQTVAQAKQMIEHHLSGYLDSPEVSVSVFAYNSKVYYIITQGAGLGDGVYRVPATGNETVLDAISQINGLDMVSSKKIWIARPCGGPNGAERLPVSWDAITAGGRADTNYQIFPGDRVYVAEDKMVAFDTAVAKLTAPLERIFGFTLLGTSTVTRLSGPVLRGGGDPGRGAF